MNPKNKKNFALREKQKQDKIRNRFMTNGVTLVAPDTIFLSSNTKIGKNVVINPYVVIGTNVKIGKNVEILSFTHIEGAKIEDNVKVGPFSFISLLSIVDRPAESYPLYSSFFNASIIFPDTGLALAIPIIPHIN